MAVALLVQHRTQVLIIDELQMMRLTSNGENPAINTLKTLMNNAGCVMVFAGVDLLTGLASRAAEQILARCNVIRMQAHSTHTDVARGHWHTLVNAFGAQMNLLDTEPDHLAPFADDLLVRTGGSIGNLRTLLKMAMATAIDERGENGTETITADMIFGSRGGSSAA